MKMPKPDNRVRFDPRPAIARMQTDTTDALRDMHPDLTWVWDELDEVRGLVDNTVPVKEFDEVEERANHWVSLSTLCAARIDKLVTECDMSAEVQAELEAVADLLDGRTEL